MLILHGDNEVISRQQLAIKISTAKLNNVEIISLSASNLTLASLDSVLSAQSLFDHSELIIIEEIHSLPRSNKKTALINLIAQHQLNAHLILWEKKALTVAQLKHFPQATIQIYKTTSTVFSWLDSLDSNSPVKHQLKLLRQAIDSNGAEYCFLMLARQVRLLIQAKSGCSLAGSPYAVKKIEIQSKKFNLKRLIDLHQRLLKVDFDQKNGSSLLSLDQELDLVIIGMSKI